MQRWLVIPMMVACGGDKAADSEPAGPPTFTEIRDDVLFKSCALSTCHLPGEDGAVGTILGEHGMLVLDPSQPDAAYDALVGFTGIYGHVLVVPGDPDASFLVAKITGAQGTNEGGAMPEPFGLDAITAGRVIEWVEIGAPNN